MLASANWRIWLGHSLTGAWLMPGHGLCYRIAKRDQSAAPPELAQP